MLKAYFDASYRPGSGMFAVAGFAFAKAQLKKFEKEWRAVFEPYGGCHMTDLANKQGNFAGISDTTADYLIREAVKIIRQRMTFGVVVSCQMGEISERLPVWVDGFQHPYPVCCHCVMIGMGVLIDKLTPGEEVAYFFESGDEYSAVAHRFMGRTDDCPELKEAYRHASHAFTESDKAWALQAADVLAWEWTKFMDETVTSRKRKMRKSLKALLGVNNKPDPRYKGLHLTGETLKWFVDNVSANATQQLHGESLAKINAAFAAADQKQPA